MFVEIVQHSKTVIGSKLWQLVNEFGEKYSLYRECNIKK